jgi:hypothetical protein
MNFRTQINDSCFIAQEPGHGTSGHKPPTLKRIKHAAFNEAWIRAGDGAR